MNNRKSAINLLITSIILNLTCSNLPIQILFLLFVVLESYCTLKHININHFEYSAFGTARSAVKCIRTYIKLNEWFHWNSQVEEKKSRWIIIRYYYDELYSIEQYKNPLHLITNCIPILFGQFVVHSYLYGTILVIWRLACKQKHVMKIECDNLYNIQ